MSYKGSTRMAEYMRQWRATKSGKISVNRKSINHFNPPNLIGSSSLSNFGILYRNGEDDFTLANPAGDRDAVIEEMSGSINLPVETAKEAIEKPWAREAEGK